MLKGFQCSIGQASILYAELLGIWLGLKSCLDLGFRYIIVESDSRVALQILAKSHLSIHWKLVILLSKIKHLSEGCNVSFVHNYREANSVADYFTNSALMNDSTQSYDPGDLPLKARQLAFNDKSGRPYVRLGKRGI